MSDQPLLWGKKAAWASIIAAGLALWTSGCLYTSETYEVRDGTKVKPDNYIGQTSEQLETKLGPPNSISIVDSKTQQWNYTYTCKTDTSDKIFVIRDIETTTRDSRHVVFYIRDGKVANGQVTDHENGGHGTGATTEAPKANSNDQNHNSP